MDFSPLIAEFIKHWYVLPILFIIAFFKSPWFKGRFGEWLINRSITRHFDSETYHLIKDVTLPTKSGTTQIDHILVSPYGVFVIETKNMKGWIFGNGKQKTWTQTVYRHKNKFQNPIRQNYKHLKVLQRLLELNNDQMHSLIIFVGNSTFKIPMPHNVTKGREFRRYIESKVDEVLSKEQVKEIVKTIESGRLERSFETNREHVKHVKRIVAYNPEAAGESPVCPNCDGTMVLRTAKYGTNKGNKFWGCSQFPSCKGTLSFTQLT